MEIPGVGALRRDDELGAHASAATPLRVLNGTPCRIVIGEEYFLDPNQQEFHAAARNLLAAGPEVLEAAAPYVFQHYERWHEAFGHGAPALTDAAEVWAQLTPAGEAFVCRRDQGDRKVYVVIGAACAWDPEHDLFFVLREGREVTRLSHYDGHLSNADAYGDPALENVIYKA